MTGSHPEPLRKPFFQLTNSKVQTYELIAEEAHREYPVVMLPAANEMSSLLKRVTMLEQGLPLTSLDRLSEQGLTEAEISALIISKRSLKLRREKSLPLSAAEGDRLNRLIRVIDVADNVFANHEKAMRWLRRENDRLNGRSPLSLLQSEVGAEAAIEMLHQIDEGMYV